MFEQCKIVIFNNIIFMKKHRKFSGKMQWKFSEIFRKNMKFSRQIFRLTSLIGTVYALLDHPGPDYPWCHLCHGKGPPPSEAPRDRPLNFFIKKVINKS